LGDISAPVCCDKKCDEEHSFGEKLKGDFFGIIDGIYNLMKLHHVSYLGMSDIRGFIYPQGKDAIYKITDFFNSAQITCKKKNPQSQVLCIYSQDLIESKEKKNA
jgi:hypothetical protein